MQVSVEEVLQSSSNQCIQLCVGRSLQPCVYWVCAQCFQVSLFSVATLALKMWIYSHYYSVALKSDTIMVIMPPMQLLFIFGFPLYRYTPLMIFQVMISSASPPVQYIQVPCPAYKNLMNLLHFHPKHFICISKRQGVCKL